MNASRAIIFDMDGVLIDSYDAHFHSWQKMLSQYGLGFTEAQFAESFGRTNPDIFAHYFPSIDPADYTARAEEKEAAYREIIQADFPEMNGATALLSRLHQAELLLGIGSSGPKPNVTAALDGLGEPYASWFLAYTHGLEVTRGKPDPEVFLKTAGKLGVEPTRCIVVEDAPAGVSAGKAAGMKVVALTGTANGEALSHADRVIDSLDEMTLEMVEEIFV